MRNARPTVRSGGRRPGAKSSHQRSQRVTTAAARAAPEGSRYHQSLCRVRVDAPNREPRQQSRQAEARSNQCVAARRPLADGRKRRLGERLSHEGEQRRGP